MKMKLDIDEVRKSGLTLEQVLALLTLELTRIGQSIPYTSIEDSDLVVLFDKGLLNADGNGYTVTKDGQIVIGKVLGAKAKEPVQKETVEATLNFEEFWNAFPSNDRHGNWLRTRTLKSDKPGCITLYKRAVTGGVKHEDLLRALRWEVNDRKSKSTTKNKLTFMKASSAWLRQREYEIILEELGDDKGETNSGDDSWLTNMV